MERVPFAQLKPIPLAIFLAPFIAGIVWAKELHGLGLLDISALYFLLGGVFFVFSSPLFFLLRGKVVTDSMAVAIRLLLLLCLFVSFFTAGYFHMELSQRTLEKRQARLLELAERGGKVVLSGYVAKLPLPIGLDTKAIIFVEKDIYRTGYVIGQPTVVTFRNLSWDQLRPGQRIVFKARLFKIRNFGTPGSFDYENWWALRGILVRAVCSSPLDILQLRDSPVHIGLKTLLHLKIEQLRMAVINTLLKSLPANISSVAIALLTGSRAWLSKDQKMRYSSAGIGHLFAVSGLHMAMMAALSVFLIRFIGRVFPWLLLRMDIRKTSWLVAILSCGLYCALAGGSPSSTRSFIMISSLAFCIIFDRRSYMEAGLFLAAWILLIKDPRYLLDVSFQLSFFVVFFLIFWGRQLHEIMSSKGYVWNIAIVCLLAWVVSSPLLAFYFHRLNPLAVFLNLFCIPVAQFLVLPGLFLGTVFSFVGCGLDTTCFTSASFGIGLMDRFATFFTSPGWIDHFVVPPRPWELFVLIFIFILVPLARTWFKVRYVALFFTVLLIAGHFVQTYLKDHRDEVALHVVDVGQGLCQVLELPDGRIFVADTGGFNRSRFDVGEHVVAPYLRRLGVKCIDILAISHPDTDHLGGAMALVRQFRVGQVWLSYRESSAHSQLFREFLSQVRLRNIPIRLLKKTDIISLKGGVCIKCLVAPENKALSKNDRGLVFKVTCPGGSLLLPGDIQKRREMVLVKEVGSKLRSQVMVVPHHGAKGSSCYRFLREVSPSVAVVSCGYKNIFHHPSSEVLQRYKGLGVMVFRTDRQGTIDIKIAGDHGVTVSGYNLQDDIKLSPKNI